MSATPRRSAPQAVPAAERLSDPEPQSTADSPSDAGGQPTAERLGAAVITSAAPPRFVADTFVHEFTVDHPRDAVWAWLVDPATFVDGQVWPYRVEFVDPETGQDAGFRSGVLTNHHGPGLNVCGVLGEIRERAYRDLRYTYGAYALSPRVARPTRLQFWLTDAPAGGTTVRLQVDAHVRARLRRPWRAGNRWFWRRFAGWLDRAVAPDG